MTSALIKPALPVDTVARPGRSQTELDHASEIEITWRVFYTLFGGSWSTEPLPTEESVRRHLEFLTGQGAQDFKVRRYETVETCHDATAEFPAA